MNLGNLAILALVGGLTLTVSAQQARLNQAPRGFTALFNGKDLSGWRGRQGDYNVYTEAKLTPEEKTAKQTQWNADRDLHWSVDAAKGELVSDGKGVFLTTVKDYTDFEFYVDWLMVSHNGDSGIYLRDLDRKSTRLNSSHVSESRMPSSA